MVCLGTSAKFDILGLFWRIFDCPANVVGIYYNYDNHTEAWPIFQQVVQLLSDMATASSSNEVKRSNKLKTGTGEESSGEREDEAEGLNERQLSDQCISLLSHLMQCLAERYQVTPISLSHTYTSLSFTLSLSLSVSA